MMHIKYPRKRGYLYWDELGCLARALGFHEKLFLHHLPDELMIGQLGIPIKTLLDAFEFYKTFHTALDRTYNIHTDEWNISVIKKALQLLDKHIFTFEEIEMIRVAYQVYESQDTRGLPLKEKVLQRVIKMCDRMISPLKMMQRVKHMVQHFEEKDRIQLHELLDLLLWCELYQGSVIKVETQSNKKDERELFKLQNFEHMLTYYDERLARELNNQYIEEELKYTKEKFGSKMMPKDVPTIDPQIRKKQVQFHKERYRFLHEEINDSSKRVNASRAGYVRSRPVSAPDVLMFQHSDPSEAVSALDVRPASVREMFPHMIRPVTAESTIQDIQSEFPRPSISEYQRPITPIAVTEHDVAEAKNKINTLKFEMETIEMKYKQLLNEDLDCLVPGYRQRAVKKPKTPPPAPVAQKVKKEQRPSKEIINKLADPHRKLMPSPSHAKTCDARFRGWYKVKTQRGPHFILVSAQFDKSPNGMMLAKMQNRVNNQVKKEPVVYRFTQRHQVLTTECVRPSTSPAVMTTTDLSTPAMDSFPASSVPSAKQKAKSETSSENARESETAASDDKNVNKSPLSDNKISTELENEWSDVAIFPDENISLSCETSPRQLQEAVDPSLAQTYLPAAKGTVKGSDFLWGRGAKLEGIREMAEEDAEKPKAISPASSKSVPSKSISLTPTENLPEMPSRVPVVKIILPETEASTTEDDVIEETQPKESDQITDAAKKKADDELFASWLKYHKKAKQYPWIRDIISHDFTNLDSKQQKKVSFAHLAKRGNGFVSRELKQRLMKGP